MCGLETDDVGVESNLRSTRSKIGKKASCLQVSLALCMLFMPTKRASQSGACVSSPPSFQCFSIHRPSSLGPQRPPSLLTNDTALRISDNDDSYHAPILIPYHNDCVGASLSQGPHNISLRDRAITLHDGCVGGRGEGIASVLWIRKVKKEGDQRSQRERFSPGGG